MDSGNTKAPELGGHTGLQTTEQGKHITRQPRPLTWRRVLLAFLDGSSLNRFEATRELRDWCLHSTVAGLEARGVRIDRHDEVVAGHFGDVHCKRYRLAAESRERAAELLERAHA